MRQLACSCAYAIKPGEAVATSSIAAATHRQSGTLWMASRADAKLPPS
jgi:hypothetical protein